MTIVDLPLDAGHDLLGERLVVCLADGQGEHIGFLLCPGLARPQYRYSYAN